MKNVRTTLALAACLLATACGGSSSNNDDQPAAPTATYVMRTGVPNPAIVFNDIDITFAYTNNLTNSIWHADSNLILSGQYSAPGYYAHPADQGGWPSLPDMDTGGERRHRLVHMPQVHMIAFTDTSDADGMASGTAADVRLATIDPTTGAVGPTLTAVFGDGYVGPCNVLSSSPDKLMILEDATTVRIYQVTSGSANLTLSSTVTLSQALPAAALGDGDSCYGGAFAWDGAFFYFTRSQTASPDQLDYDVFDAMGVYVSTFTASGTGSFNAVYFDWSAGRYTIHDGWGGRSGGTLYTGTDGASDTQCYGPVSPYHTAAP